MLILRRKSGESIVIGENINVTVLDINEGSVRIAIDAPKAIPILRSELLQAADANRDSAATAGTQSRNLLRFLDGKSNGGQGRPRALRPIRTASLIGPEPADVAPPAPPTPSDAAPTTQPADDATTTS